VIPAAEPPSSSRTTSSMPSSGEKKSSRRTIQISSEHYSWNRDWARPQLAVGGWVLTKPPPWRAAKPKAVTARLPV
jgi:hypothetical protein